MLHTLPRPILHVGDGMTDAVTRDVVDGFAAYTGFVMPRPSRPYTVARMAGNALSTRPCPGSWLSFRGITSILVELMQLRIDIEQEADGRWLAEVEALPGVLVYGMTRTDAVAKVQALALRALAERLDHCEAVPEMLQVSFQSA
jgi:predicted RNase H-like HicB family nuclease